MKKMKFNRLAGRTIAAGFVLGLFMAAQSAAACTLQNWSGVSGLTDADNAGGPTDGIPRYSGVCAMQAADAAVSFVEDMNPDGIDRIRARFYVLANNPENAVIYEGFNGSTSVFTIELGADGTIALSGDGLSQPLEATGVSGKWNSIEVDWNAGAGQVNLWVNSDAASDGADAFDTSLSSGEVVTSVRLGNLEGVAGSLSFDAYESRRTTAVGRLCTCDSTGDEQVNITDVVTIINEAGGLGLSPFQPDCNEDGDIGIIDIVTTVNLAGTTQACL